MIIILSQNFMICTQYSQGLTSLEMVKPDLSGMSFAKTLLFISRFSKIMIKIFGYTLATFWQHFNNALVNLTSSSGQIPDCKSAA